MAVVGELVQAQVGHQHGVVAELVVQPPQRDVQHAVRVVGAGAGARPCARARRRSSGRRRRPRPPRPPPSPGSRGCAARRRASTRSATGSSMPSRTNIGSTRSARAHLDLGDEPAQRGGATQPARTRGRERRQIGQRHGSRLRVRSGGFRAVSAHSTTQHDQPAATSSTQNVVGLLASLVAVKVSATLCPA